jgi:hypothetical protein
MELIAKIVQAHGVKSADDQLVFVNTGLDARNHPFVAAELTLQISPRPVPWEISVVGWRRSIASVLKVAIVEAVLKKQGFRVGRPAQARHDDAVLFVSSQGGPLEDEGNVLGHLITPQLRSIKKAYVVDGV